jgi:hypothetical protein
MRPEHFHEYIWEMLNAINTKVQSSLASSLLKLFKRTLIRIQDADLEIECLSVDVSPASSFESFLEKVNLWREEWKSDAVVPDEDLVPSLDCVYAKSVNDFMSASYFHTN